MSILFLNSTPFGSFPKRDGNSLSGVSTFEPFSGFRGRWIDYENRTWDSLANLTWNDLQGGIEITRKIEADLEFNPTGVGTITVGKNISADLEFEPTGTGTLTNASNLSGTCEFNPTGTGTLTRVINIYDYLDQIQSNSSKHLVYMDLLRQDETIERTISNEIQSGNITIQLVNGIRRTCDIVISNINNVVNINEFDLWVGKKFRIRMGVIVQGQEFLFNQGVFVVTNVERNNNQSDVTMRINGRDKWSLVDGSNNGNLGATTIINQGATIVQSLDDILKSVNDPKYNQINFEATTQTVPHDIILNNTSNYGELLNKFAVFLGRDAYFDVNGRFTMEEPKVPADRSSVFTFTRDNSMISNTVRYEFPTVFNVINFTGTSLPNGIIVSATARNDDPSDPLSTIARGEKARDVNSDVVVDNAQAQISANYELSRTIGLQDSINITSTKLYHLDVGNIININDSLGNIDGNVKYEINNITIGLLPTDTMQLQVSRARKFVT